MLLPAPAYMETTDRNGQFADRVAEVQRHEQAVSTMEQHIKIVDGQFVLSAVSGDAIGVDQQLFASLKASLEQTNAELRAGTLRLKGASWELAQPGMSSPEVLSSCAGRTGVSWHWWGRKTYFNRCHTEDLILAINAGAGAATLCAIMSGGWAVPCGIGGLLLAAGAQYLSWLNNRWGRGVYIVSYRFGGGYAWHQ